MGILKQALLNKRASAIQKLLMNAEGDAAAIRAGKRSLYTGISDMRHLGDRLYAGRANFPGTAKRVVDSPNFRSPKSYLEDPKIIKRFARKFAKQNPEAVGKAHGPNPAGLLRGKAHAPNKSVFLNPETYESFRRSF